MIDEQRVDFSNKILMISRRVTGSLNRGTEIVAAVFLVLLTVGAILQVISRHLFDITFTWTEELSRFSFIWATMLGACILSHNGGHATLDFLDKALTGKFLKLKRALIEMAVMVVMVTLAICSVPLITTTMQQLSPALQVPMSTIYLAVSVFAVITTVHSCARMVEVVAQPDASSDIGVAQEGAN